MRPTFSFLVTSRNIVHQSWSLEERFRHVCPLNEKKWSRLLTYLTGFVRDLNLSGPSRLPLHSHGIRFSTVFTLRRMNHCRFKYRRSVLGPSKEKVFLPSKRPRQSTLRRLVYLPRCVLRFHLGWVRVPRTFVVE